MHVMPHLPLEELKRLERAEKNADRSKRMRIVILGLEGWTAPAVAMAVGLSRRICQRWVARYNEQGLAGLDDLRGQKSELPLTEEQRAAVRERVDAGPTEAWRITLSLTAHRGCPRASGRRSDRGGRGLCTARQGRPTHSGQGVWPAAVPVERVLAAASTRLQLLATPTAASQERPRGNQCLPIRLARSAQGDRCCASRQTAAGLFSG